MTADGSGGVPFEIYCLLCGKQLSEDDDIHLMVGPYGYDFDVLCTDCASKSPGSGQAQPDEFDLTGFSAGFPG